MAVARASDRVFKGDVLQMEPIIAALNNLFPPPCRTRVVLVGGCVRDHLLGRSGGDIDLAAALSPAEFDALGFRLVAGRTTAPIRIRHDPAIGLIEATPLETTDDLAGELRRRDFTANAIAMTLDGRFIDPLNGLDDLERKRLVPCSPATFLDDPLRIFRAFRFTADGWRLTGECSALIRQQTWRPLLSPIPVERFSREMLKALAALSPGRFFRHMIGFDVGDGWLPELFRFPRIPAGPPEHHPEGDLLSHALQVMERVAAETGDPLARFCALFHDIGKLATDPSRYPRHHGHDEAGFRLALPFCDRLRLPAACRSALSWTSRLHGTMNRWRELRPATRIRVAEQAARSGITDILPLVSQADKPGAMDHGEWRLAVETAAMTTAELGIDPQQLAALPPTGRGALVNRCRVDRLCARLHRPKN